METKNAKKYGSKKELILVNSVTALRFLASFLVIPIFKTLGGISASIFSAIFLFTDFIDGFLARKLKASTFFGAAFDGITDKMYSIITFSLLMAINPVIFSIPLLLELGILFTQNKKLENGANIKSNMSGKIKTWFLSLSMITSFIAVDLLNIEPAINYLKYASLDKISLIKDSLLLLGIELPAIVMQLLTLKSYDKEAQIAKEDIKQEETKNKEEEIAVNADLEQNYNETLAKLQEITNQKQELMDELTMLEKIKILKDKLFDPEYYAENKDEPIRKLTKDLFNK